MEKTTDKKNSPAVIRGRTIIVAHGEEPATLIPLVVVPVQIELALRIVHVEIRNVAIVVQLRDGALYDKPSIPPPIE